MLAINKLRFYEFDCKQLAIILFPCCYKEADLDERERPPAPAGESRVYADRSAPDGGLAATSPIGPGP